MEPMCCSPFFQVINQGNVNMTQISFMRNAQQFSKPIRSPTWDATNDQALLLVTSSNQKWIRRDDEGDFFFFFDVCVLFFPFVDTQLASCRSVQVYATSRGGGLSTFRNACEAKWGYLATRQYIQEAEKVERKAASECGQQWKRSPKPPRKTRLRRRASCPSYFSGRSTREQPRASVASCG